MPTSSPHPQSAPLNEVTRSATADVPVVRLVILSRFLLTTASLIALYLGFAADGNLPDLEAGGSSTVFSGSRWGHLAGVPIPFFGAASYTLLLLLSGRVVRGSSGLTVSLGLGLTLITTLAAIYFLMVQHFFVGGLCGWCGITHGLAVGGACILIAARSRQFEEKHRQTRDSLTGLAIASTAIALLFIAQSQQHDQTLIETVTLTPTGRAPDTRIINHGDAKLISLHGGHFSINPEHFPAIGSAFAENFIIVVTDYTSADCRQLHRQLVDLQWQYGDRLAVLEIPGGLDAESLMIHRMLLALRELNPSEYTALSESIYASKHLGQLKHQHIMREISRRVSASEMLDIQQRLGNQIDHRITLAQQLQEANALRTGTTVLPQIIIGSQVIAGAPDDADFYARLVKRNLHLSPEIATADGIAAARPKLPAILELNEARIELGKVGPGAVIPLSINVVNAGEQALEITWVRFEKDCRLVATSQTPIYPTQAGSVDLVVTIPHGKLGIFERKLKIHSNANPDGDIVTIVGEFDPSKLIRSPQAQASVSGQP